MRYLHCADLVKERNEISEPVVYDEMSVTVAADGSIAISGADEETLKKAEAIKNAGLTGGGNYTLPDFTAQN